MNSVRGEAEVQIGGGRYILAADMEGLAQLSGLGGCQTLPELYKRMIGTELGITRAALAAFVQSGTAADGKALKKKEAAALALASFSLSDTAAVQECFITILGALTRKPDDSADEPGNRSPPLN